MQGIVDHVQAFLDVARGSDLDHVVLMTALGMQYAPAEVEQRAVEIAVQAGPWRSSILRPNWFYQNITEGVLRDLAEAGEGVLRLPTADAAVSFIDARDIVAVSARILAGTAGDDEYGLTGSQALTFGDIAQASAASGGTIRAYESVTDPEFRSTVVGLGWDETYVEVLSGLMATIAAKPGARSRSLAGDLGSDQAALKLNIRKLKNLGLTRSLDSGYQISPRGRRYLERWWRQQQRRPHLPSWRRRRRRPLYRVRSMTSQWRCGAWFRCVLQNPHVS